MTADDLSAPLGRRPKKQRHSIRLPVPQIMAGALGLFLVVFVLWAVIGDDPFGGEPMAVVPANLKLAAKPPDAPAPVPQPAPPAAAAATAAPAADSHPATAAPPAQPEPANSTTVTIIDGKTGEKKEVVVPTPPQTAAPPAAAASGAAPQAVPQDQKFLEMSPQGPIPKVAADGTRPAEAFARPVKPLPGKPDAPRIALIVGGLGIGANATAEAIAKLPGSVTLSFVPYGNNVAALAGRAHAAGHEILLQVPMEPLDYPDNDPGPQTLLTTLAPQQNMDRLYWLMSRFQGYVGITNTMSARFTAAEPSFAPILRETAKRGLIFVDDGANPRSLAGRIAGANNLPFARADVVLDTVPTPAEIDRALGRLEMTARERGVAVGIASPLPVSIDHIAKWAKAAESRGLLLIPISAVAAKAKQS
jgi:polysaccharide deacetylase 2 family uncharacterized protein YibQ